MISRSHLFSDKEILKLAGSKNTKIISYPTLKTKKTLRDVFGRKKNVIILYVHDNTPNGTIGHWCCLIKHPTTVEFFDSYSMMPDDIIRQKTENDRRKTNQEKNYLSKLLYKSNIPIDYNEYPYQASNDNTNTCGAHTGLRCRF